MKKILFLIIIIILNMLHLSANAEESQYKVVKIIDGDTIYIDFNNNGIAEQDEKVRINGIDTFETKSNDSLIRQMKEYNLTLKEALGLGYYGKEFAEKNLLNKYVTVEYTADSKTDKHNRKLMSVYYDCKNDNCKDYAKEVLKAGYAVIYRKSDIASELKQYENQKAIQKNVKNTQKLNLVYLNPKTKKYHKLNCPIAEKSNNMELIITPIEKYKPAECCHKNNTF